MQLDWDGHKLFLMGMTPVWAHFGIFWSDSEGVSPELLTGTALASDVVFLQRTSWI